MLDYNSISVQKSGYTYYVSFLDENNEDVFYSEVYFDEEEIESDSECCINVISTYCDKLSNDEEEQDEVDEEFYELRTEVYDHNIELIVVFSILDLLRDNKKFYIQNRKFYMDSKCVLEMKWFSDLVEYIDEIVNETIYDNEEHRVKSIKEGVEFIKEYFLKTIGRK